MHPLRKLVLKPTVFCYHKCPYCDLRQDFYGEMLKVSKETARHNKPGQMPFEMAAKQITDAYVLGMRECLFSGGDPLLYPRLEELIRIAGSLDNVFVFMNSVGTGLTHTRADSLLDAGLNAWNFSVDTLDPQLYDMIRGVKGAFTQIMDAIAVLRGAVSGRTAARPFYINLMSVITRHTFRTLPTLLEFCLDNGVASVFLMNVYGDDEDRAFLLTVDEIAEFRSTVVPKAVAVIENSGVADIVKTNAADVLASFYPADNSDENYERGVWWKDFATVKRACRVPNSYALVEADGTVLPCCLMEIAHEGAVGNVTANSLREVWEGDSYRAFRDERISFCQKCPVPQHKTVAFVPELCRQFLG